jgi:hypothetical protein
VSSCFFSPLLFTKTCNIEASERVKFSLIKNVRLKKERKYLCSAYDRAAIKFRGVEADINFSIEDYEEDLKQVCLRERDL